VVAGIAVSALTTGLVLLIGELAARTFASPSVFIIPTADNCLRRSPSLGMEFIPNCATSWNDELLTGNQGTTFRTNSLGLRDGEIANDNAPRILALGDSCTWGWQAAQDEAYPQVLQQLLDPAPDGQHYRVINAGRPGYTSYQGLTYLRDSGLGLQPAIVIIAFGFNDALPTGDVEEDLQRQRRFMTFITLDDFLLGHSSLWRWARDLTRAKNPPPRAQRVAPDTYRRNLARMIELVRDHGAKPLLLSFDSPPGGTSVYGNAIGQVASELRVPLVVYTGPRIDVVHPTKSGYARLAAAIRDRLQQEEYLTKP
jgi:lysophospholipase L1-like esterase